MIEYLGGVCARCSTTSGLQFDHIDSKTKKFDISSNWARAWETLVVELDKCQLLCGPHHKKKSVESKDHAGGHNKLKDCPHGTQYGYSGRWKCRCDLCKTAKREGRLRLLKRDIAQLG
jgi:hypothetical protein